MRAARVLGSILAARPAGVTHGYAITEIEPEPFLVNIPRPSDQQLLPNRVTNAAAEREQSHRVDVGPGDGFQGVLHPVVAALMTLSR